MTEGQFRGIFSIPVTPFHPDGSVDYDSLRRCVEFTLECGAHGIVSPVNASEYYTLSDEERRAVIRTVVETVNGRAPVIPGVTGLSTHHAVEMAKFAEDAGVSAVMSMPPITRVMPPEHVREYFEALGRAVSIPIFIQNNPKFCATAMSGEFMAGLVRDIEHMDYIKEESAASGHVITAVLREAGEALKGVMGGMAGRYVLDEYRRGACGSMPACDATDVHVRLWDHLESGRWREARDVFNRLLPLLNHEEVFGVNAYKEVLYRRGAIASPTVRLPARKPRDQYDQQELSDILDDLSELMTWKPSGARARAGTSRGGAS